MIDLLISYENTDLRFLLDVAIQQVVEEFGGEFVGAFHAREGGPRTTRVEFPDAMRAAFAIVGLRRLPGVDVHHATEDEMSPGAIFKERGDVVLSGIRELLESAPDDQYEGVRAGWRWTADLLQRSWSGQHVDTTPPIPDGVTLAYSEGFKLAVTRMRDLMAPYDRRLANLRSMRKPPGEPETVEEVTREMVRRIQVALLHLVESLPREQHAGVLKAYDWLEDVASYTRTRGSLDELPPVELPDPPSDFDRGFAAATEAIEEVIAWAAPRFKQLEREPVFIN